MQRSGLAEFLPGGLSNLPDIAAASPELLRPIVRFFAPRTLEQLVAHVVRHLDWYMEPGRSTIGWHRFFSPLAIGLIELAAWLVLATVGRNWPFDLAAAVLFSTFFILLVLFIGISALSMKYQSRDELAALELYLYLRDRFADPVDTEEESAPAAAREPYSLAEACAAERHDLKGAADAAVEPNAKG